MHKNKLKLFFLIFKKKAQNICIRQTQYKHNKNIYLVKKKKHLNIYLNWPLISMLGS